MYQESAAAAAAAHRIEREALIAAIQRGEITPEPFTADELAQFNAIVADLGTMAGAGMSLRCAAVVRVTIDP